MACQVLLQWHTSTSIQSPFIILGESIWKQISTLSRLKLFGSGSHITPMTGGKVRKTDAICEPRDAKFGVAVIIFSS